VVLYIPETAAAGSVSAGDVAVLDIQTNTLVTTIPIASSGLAGIAILPDGSRAYVTDSTGSTVSVIDTHQNVVTETITVGSGPRAIAVSPDGKLAYVANRVSNSVSVIDTASSTVVNTVPVGVQPWALAFATDGTQLYVANLGEGSQSTSSISVISVSTGKVVKTIAPPGFPEGVAASPTDHLVYVVEGGFGLDVISTETNEIVAEITFDANGGIAVSPDGSTIYVSNLGQFDPNGNTIPSTLFVIDAVTRSIVATPQTSPGLNFIALSADGRTAFITDSVTLPSPVAFDTKTRTFSTNLVHSPGAANGIAVLPNHAEPLL
jgi:YVTN family beta-propeller protein